MHRADIVRRMPAKVVVDHQNVYSGARQRGRVAGQRLGPPTSGTGSCLKTRRSAVRLEKHNHDRRWTSLGTHTKNQEGTPGPARKDSLYCTYRRTAGETAKINDLCRDFDRELAHWPGLCRINAFFFMLRATSRALFTLHKHIETRARALCASPRPPHSCCVLSHSRSSVSTYKPTNARRSMRLLRIAFLTLCRQAASPAWSFVHHPSPQALSMMSGERAGGGGDRPGAVGLRMVASAPVSTAVNAPTINGGADVDRSRGREKAPQDAGKAAAVEAGEGLRTVEMYDTTLRDGTQMEGISASVDDKLKISRQLADFGELICIC